MRLTKGQTTGAIIILAAILALTLLRTYLF